VIVAVPTVTPVTTPVADPMAATEALPLLHVPPPPSVKVVICPWQTEETPVIAPGNALTVTIAVT